MFWDYQPSTNKANLLNSLLWIKNISESSFITASDTHLISIIILKILSSLFLIVEVQFRPYRTDDFITRLYYETPRFTVLNQTWVLKARVNDSERNPNLSCKRTLSFQLILKSKVNSTLECSFLLLKGPYDDVKIKPVIQHHVFSNDANETEYAPLPISDSVECNKLLAAKNINLRLFIFQIQK